MACNDFTNIFFLWVVLLLVLRLLKNFRFKVKLNKIALILFKLLVILSPIHFVFQHMDIMIWLIRHNFLENVGSRYTNFTAWRSSVRERKSAASTRAWPESVNHSADSTKTNVSTLFIEDALSNIEIEREHADDMGGELEIASLQKDGSSLFFRSKIEEGMAGCYPFESLRAAADVLFLHGTSDLVVAKQAIVSFFIYCIGASADVRYLQLVEYFVLFP